MAYTVVRGDTLGRIAAANGMTLDELLALNPDYRSNPNMVRTGAKINVTPTSTEDGGDAEEVVTSTGGSYTVIKGDTLGRIASANGLSLAELLELNPDISNPNLIQVGQTINLGEAAPGTVTAEPEEPEEVKEFDGYLDGGTVHKVDGGQSTYYVMAYEYPAGSGNMFYYNIGDEEALMATAGDDALNGALDLGADMDEDGLADWVDGGDSNEIIDIDGNWNQFMDDTIREAGIAAGINDPTKWGQAIQDPGIALLLAKDAIGDWTDEQYLAALRNEPYYYEVLKPGIQNLYGSSTDPEAAYAMYTQNVTQVLNSLGIPKDPNGSYDTQFQKLLDAGVTDTAFSTFASTYKQAQTSVGFADALSKWTERFAGTSIASFEDWYDVLAGNAPAEMQEIAELAGLQYMADNQGFNITDAELEALGADTNLSQQGAGALFSSTAKALLALGERGLRRGGLTSNEILQAQAGIGGDTEAIKLRMSKLAREEGISDDPTAAIFTDFNREGAPIKKGLGSSISEGA